MEDVLAEIFLRLPPDEPACLFRASLVCKTWLRVVSDADFPRRYRERHGAPPVLCYLHNKNYHIWSPARRLIPTTAVSPFSSLAPPSSPCGWVFDARHGRVLLESFGRGAYIVIWDPVTGDEHLIALPKHLERFHTGAVLCAARGCNHLDCHGGPFLVVALGLDSRGHGASAAVYSSETGAWSAPTSFRININSIDMGPSLLAGDGVYFMCSREILMYDMGTHELWTLNSPLDFSDGVLTTAEDGELGIAGVDGSTINVWSLQEVGHSGVLEWVWRMAIDLDTLFPAGCDTWPDLLGFAEGTDTVFVDMDDAVFALELKSRRINKVSDSVGCRNAIVPYASFYTPASNKRLRKTHAGKEICATGSPSKKMKLAQRSSRNDDPPTARRSLSKAVVMPTCIKHATAHTSEEPTVPGGDTLQSEGKKTNRSKGQRGKRTIVTNGEEQKRDVKDTTKHRNLTSKRVSKLPAALASPSVVDGNTGQRPVASSFESVLYSIATRRVKDDKDSPTIAHIGGFWVSHGKFSSSMRPRQWVGCDVIDVYCKAMAFDEKCSQSSSLLTKCFLTTDATRKLKQRIFNVGAMMKEFDIKRTQVHVTESQMIMIPNCDDSHWWLIVANMRDRRFDVLSSMDLSKSQESETRTMCNNMKTVLQGLDPTNETLNMKQCKIVVHGVPKQNTMFDCGVYTMKFMQLWDGRKIPPITKADIPVFRKKLSAYILAHKDNADTIPEINAAINSNKGPAGNHGAAHLDKQPPSQH